MFALQASDHHLRITHRESTDFRHAGAHGIGGIETIDVEADVSAAFAGDAVDLADNGIAPDLLMFIHGHDAETGIGAPFDIVLAEAAAAQADLDRSLGIDQSFFDAAPESGRVIDLGAEQFIERVGMRIELNDADGAAARDGAQDRQGHRVIAANGDRYRAGLMDLAEERFDETDALAGIQRIDRRVSDIGDIAQTERRDAAGRIELADDARSFADGCRTVTGAGTEIHAQVEGNTGSGNIDL